MKTAVFAGGPGVDCNSVSSIVQSCDYFLAADSGAQIALKSNIIPNKVMGDLDSISDSTLLELRKRQVPFELFPPEKDMSDTEICLRSVPKSSEIVLICSLSGRPDHVMCNLMLVIKLHSEGYKICATDGTNYFFPMCGEDSLVIEGISNPENVYVSMMPTTIVTGVMTLGLYYSLEDVEIYPGSSFTLSNRLGQSGNSFKISSKSGEMGVFVVREE
ncbi:MAG: thiamine diphosphokinase [Saccharofermentans sp.]|nr:thiamine diphosphokinase [Saccharofermentans sp.]